MTHSARSHRRASVRSATKQVLGKPGVLTQAEQHVDRSDAHGLARIVDQRAHRRGDVATQPGQYPLITTGTNAGTIGSNW